MNHVQYVTNNNNIQTHRLVTVTFLNPSVRLFIHVSKSSSWHALEQKLPILMQGQKFHPLYRRQKPRHEHIVRLSTFANAAAFSNSFLSNSSSEKLSPSASAMTATRTLTMCSTNKYPKERFMITFN